MQQHHRRQVAAVCGQHCVGVVQVAPGLQRHSAPCHDPQPWGTHQHQLADASRQCLRPQASAEAAEAALQALEDSPLGQRYATVAPAWRRAWTHVVPFFAFPPEVRRMVYTTNAIESVHARLRKVIKTRGHFPTDEAATKLIWLALRNIRTVWNKPPIHWTAAMNQFAILFGDRIERAVP